MDLLTVKHHDFTMLVDCDKFHKIWDKAVANVHEENLYANYGWSDGVESVKIGDNPIESGTQSKAVFFDNADYPLWVEFRGGVRDAWFNTANRKVAENFKFRKERQILSGFLNYGNEIGKSEIVINYVMDNGERRNFRFTFDVLSTKLDYHEHWREIIRGIEQEYRMLSIDFLKKTFHSFEISEVVDTTHDLIWWQLFTPLREEFIASCKSILDRPRHRLKDHYEYQRAEKIKHFTPLLENEYARFKDSGNHLYRVEVPTLNNDTFENRFLKYALQSLSDQHKSLAGRILRHPNITDIRRHEIENSVEEMDALNFHPFFRTVGPFKGITHESLILQNDTHYSNVYRTWLILKQSYSLNDGLHNLETKDIATLYEIWCYIQLKEIVRKQLGDGIEIDNESRVEMNGIFGGELGKGDKSRILFRNGNVELAELIYNPTQGDNDHRDINIDNLVSRTVPQKPDIVLRLTKKEPESDLKLTYLFDAKYRIDGKDKGVDVPPEDAINQMHRYRDAIYYTEHGQQELKKEVIGGYILFPGNGDPAKMQVARFYRSIDDVNIGAFPLRPKDEENRKLLEDFINTLLTTRAKTILTQDNIIPQKGLTYIGDENVLGKDELCLVCFTSKDRLEKVLKSRIYYLRTGERDGAFPYSPDVAAIRKVILIPVNINEDAYVYEVNGDGPRIVNGKYLRDKKGFAIKDKNNIEPYIAYDLKNVSRKSQSELNLSSLPGYASIKQEPYIRRQSDLTI